MEGEVTLTVFSEKCLLQGEICQPLTEHLKFAQVQRPDHIDQSGDTDDLSKHDGGARHVNAPF